MPRDTKSIVKPFMKDNDHIDNNDVIVNMDTTKQRILDEIIMPSYYKQVKDLIEYKFTWRKVGNWTETISQVLILVGAVLAFASSTYDMRDLVFTAGVCNVTSLLLKRFSVYAFGESKERIHQVNKVLRHLGIDELPSFTQGDTSNSALKSVRRKGKKITAFEVGDVIDVHRQIPKTDSVVVRDSDDDIELTGIIRPPKDNRRTELPRVHRKNIKESNEDDDSKS
jgi:hypothetical protein